MNKFNDGMQRRFKFVVCWISILLAYDGVGRLETFEQRMPFSFESFCIKFLVSLCVLVDLLLPHIFVWVS
jgi:hypothetical protein